MNTFYRLTAAALLALTLAWAPAQSGATEMISKDLALKFANKYIPGTIVSVNERFEDSHLYYDFVIRNPEGDLYDVTVDAHNGNVLRVKIRESAPAQ